MAQATRIAILPRGVASPIITRAVSRAGWGFSVATLLLTIPVLIDVMLARGLGASLWLPLVCIAALLALLAVGRWRPSTATRVLYLLGGGAIAFVYTVGLLSADPSLNDEAGFLLNRPATVLVLGGVLVSRLVVGAAWSGIGFVVAMAVLVLAAVVVGVNVAPGWGPALALVVVCGVYLALAAIRSRQSRQIPDLAKLEADTRRLSIEDQFERRAAAIVHDTVLSDLTAVMNSTGPIGDRVRERFRADVATLGDAAWLRESADDTDASPLDAVLRNALEVLVSDFQWRGLTVDVTGDSDSVMRVSPGAASSLVAAVRACLDNVLDHAQTASAELVLSTSAESVTAMVIDHGVGFDSSHIAADRLGLRASVVTRIRSHGGSVRLWSTPGSGTSVLITVPSAERGPDAVGPDAVGTDAVGAEPVGAEPAGTDAVGTDPVGTDAG